MATRDALVSELRDRLTRTGSPRLTVLIILAFAGGAAFLTSFAGLSAGVDSMAVRYALASIAGYLAFVALIRGWIAIRRGWQPEGDIDIPNPFDVLDATDIAARGAGRGAQALKAFAGGRSGGGGSGSTWIPEPVEKVTSVRDASSMASKVADGGGGSLDLDEGIFIVIAILAALGGVMCVAYVIYIAPLLLAEVALDAALVSAAYRRLRKDDVGHWTGAVFRRTWIPAVILVIFMFVTGFAAQRVAPDARSIGDVVRALTVAHAAEERVAPRVAARDRATQEPQESQEPQAKPDVNPLIRERSIGLLNLPDVIGQPCGPETPVTLDLYDTPSTAKPPIGAITDDVSGRTPDGVACSEAKTVVWRARGGISEAMPMEESDYEVPSVIVYQRSGSWFRIALPRGSAWIRRDDAKDFLRYPEMLSDRLTHLAAGWDGRLWHTPGVSAAKAVSPKVKALLKEVEERNGDVDVHVLAVRRVRGEAWIQVRVVAAHCGDGPEEMTLDIGWIPAYRATREPAVWFYSRGC